ncbi:MAG: MaoC family dehydratase [Thermaerobacter sp.]|nr:MaoC family dehydratase [Thermaerobacter sp.]
MKIGDSQVATYVVDEEKVRAFAAVSTDWNPIHVDSAYAKKTRFGRPIVHGGLIMSFVSALLGQELPGPGSIYLTQNATFRAPVFVGDKVTVSVTVKEIRPNGVVTLEHLAHVNDRVVLEGKSVILFEPVVDG